MHLLKIELNPKFLSGTLKYLKWSIAQNHLFVVVFGLKPTKGCLFCETYRVWSFWKWFILLNVIEQVCATDGKLSTFFFDENEMNFQKSEKNEKMFFSRNKNIWAS